MRIFVTGGAGFIGSHTVIELFKAGHGVVVADNLCNSSPVALERAEEILAEETGKRRRSTPAPGAAAACWRSCARSSGPTGWRSRTESGRAAPGTSPRAGATRRKRMISWAGGRNTASRRCAETAGTGRKTTRTDTGIENSGAAGPAVF